MDNYVCIDGKQIQLSKETAQELKKKLGIITAVDPITISTTYNYINITRIRPLVFVDKKLNTRIFVNQNFASGSVFGSNCVFIKCLFGSNCTFGKNSLFSGYCEFGPNCNFGYIARFGSNCKFGPHCTFGAGSMFGLDCEYGPGCLFAEYEC
jgi:acetyltransferase-like isoleucine patch superfamily enzyme